MTTVTYATSKLLSLESRARLGPVRAAWDTYAHTYVPGLPFSAWIGATGSSQGLSERVPLGLWGLELPWLRGQLQLPEVQLELGRAVTVETLHTDAWAQCYLGLRRYAQALHEAIAAAHGVGVDVRASTTSWSPWEFQLAVASYSSGQGTLATLLRAAVRAAPTCLDAAPGRRWTAVASALGPELRSRARIAGVRVAGTVGAAWCIVRPRERYECGRALQGRMRSLPAAPAPWYSDAPWRTPFDRMASRLAHRGAR